MTLVANLPPVSLVPVVHLDLRISPRILEKTRYDPNEIVWGWGEIDSRKKTRSKKSRDSIPFNCYFGTSFGISQSKIYLLYLGKTNIRSKPMRIWLRNTAFLCKFANLQFADSDTKEICGFAIYIFANVRFADWHI